MSCAAPLLAVEHLVVAFGAARAVDDVSLELWAGETVGLVGESGSGKTTLARAALRLIGPAEGTVRWSGRDVTQLGSRRLRPLRGQLGIVFQDPGGSLNPRRRVGRALAEARGAIDGQAGGAAVAGALAEVGLSEKTAERFPHELSGGERQRVALARALATEPRALIADEPVSALDPSVQAQVLQLLARVQARRGLGLLLVAHDLALVRRVSRRIAVMYAGKLVEAAPAAELVERPRHPYTAALVAAVPSPDPRVRASAPVPPGEPASALRPPPACRFHPRCPRATAVCREEEPALTAYPGGRFAACHHPLDVSPEELSGARVAAGSPRSASARLPDAA
jgi:oligopeptide/dipeptide ABC transporter ATP-binding protein